MYYYLLAQITLDAIISISGKMLLDAYFRHGNVISLLHRITRVAQLSKKARLTHTVQPFLEFEPRGLTPIAPSFSILLSTDSAPPLPCYVWDCHI